MLALLTIFEHLSNVRRLLNRFRIFQTSPTRSETNPVSTEVQPSSSDILLAPLVTNILSDQRLLHCDDQLQNDLRQDEYFARELDACLLEIRQIERDLQRFKQRQCTFYENYLEFIEQKDQLIEMFIDYHERYIQSHPKKSGLRRRSTEYEFNIPVSNRFEVLKRLGQ